MDVPRNLSGSVSQRMQNLLRIALAQVGARDSGDQGSITKFTGGKTGWPWDAKFVSWCYRQAGMPLPGGDQWAVATIKSTVKRLGQWQDASNLQPGMACTFRTRSHIEIVASPVHKSGKLAGYMTIGARATPGGNRQGVAHEFRSLAELEGGGYPVRV